MNTSLSSQIKLYEVPRRCYAPADEIEQAQLTRKEKVYTRIFENVADGSEYVARRIVRVLKRSVEEKGKFVIALDAGEQVQPVCSMLADMYRRGEVSFRNVVVFTVSEFFPLKEGGPSTLKRLRELLLDHVDIAEENIRPMVPNVNKEDLYEYCRDYEAMIAREGGLDMTVCELGRTGSLGFNEPGSTESSFTRLVLLTNESRQRAASTYKTDNVTDTAITLGIRNILASHRVMAMAWGDSYAGTVYDVVEGPITPAVPASYMQRHAHVRLAVDLPAAAQLTRISRPWKVTSCQWNDKLVRRAIVWLSRETGKVILKLTDKDYNDYGLDELLALYGSAYNVNIKVFNELQHTITGWPGGKPDADDSCRPERATPYPKRVVVFSPHPDDDVISMGATLQRLVDQGHQVHVAYETSGNIAVGDEDMMRYFIMMDRIAPMFGFDNECYRDLTAEVSRFVAGKKDGESDLPEIREIKTMIRQAEATIACRYMGVPDNNIHFLRLPFYETGAIKKGDLTERDINIVVSLLSEVMPHQIFVAGDLSDPHGTHRVCTDAVLAAISILKDEPWMKECRVWMYRGAWAEWEIDHIEMAVPISPEQLRRKRNAILKHQSQMENAPFLGNDDRLFWQRAEERNRATAALYHSLGLASYEAIEAFVEYRTPSDVAVPRN